MKVRALAIPLLLGLLPTLALSQTGVASLSSPINWSQTPDLYFNVNGGPPNMCGSLETDRNGIHLSSPGWICTGPSGNATMGPWTWANTPGDQTDTNIHIHWTNGTDTYANSGHVWDKTCPTAVFTTASGSPPTNLAGNADDNQWGAGFNSSWTKVKADFQDTSTGNYWSPFTGNYDSPFIQVSAQIIGMPGHSIFWTFAGSIPSAGAHVPTHHYVWSVNLYDGDSRCTPPAFIPLQQSFTY